MLKSVVIIALLPIFMQCSKTVPTVTLNNGVEMPILGLGTFRSKRHEVEQAVKDAIDIGYRHIDCAEWYANEKEVGQAIAEKISQGVVKREDLFITSKLWNTFHDPNEVEGVLKKTLSDLGLKYVDLYLIHFPMGFTKDEKAYTDFDYVDTWLAMEKVYKKGLAKSIGISNFNKKQIERVLEHGTVVPVTNQVESHPYLNQKKLIDFCNSKNIKVTAHTPLGSAMEIPGKPNIPTLLANPQLALISDRLHKTPAQIMIRYQIQRGVAVIPKSVKKNRIQENFNVLDFELSDKDMEIINGMDINGRIVILKENQDHKYYPFFDEY